MKVTMLQKVEKVVRPHIEAQLQRCINAAEHHPYGRARSKYYKCKDIPKFMHYAAIMASMTEGSVHLTGRHVEIWDRYKIFATVNGVRYCFTVHKLGLSITACRPRNKQY